MLVGYRQRDNYLERQLEEFNDQTKEMEGALFVKQMEVAGTVFNVQEYMPNREVCFTIISTQLSFTIP